MHAFLHLLSSVRKSSACLPAPGPALSDLELWLSFPFARCFVFVVILSTACGAEILCPLIFPPVPPASARRASVAGCFCGRACRIFVCVFRQARGRMSIWFSAGVAFRFGSHGAGGMHKRTTRQFCGPPSGSTECTFPSRPLKGNPVFLINMISRGALNHKIRRRAAGHPPIKSSSKRRASADCLADFAPRCVCASGRGWLPRDRF